MQREFLLPLLLLMPFLCTAEEGPTDRGPLQLTLKRAVELALSPEGNTWARYSCSIRRYQSARAAVRAAKADGARRTSKCRLLSPRSTWQHCGPKVQLSNERQRFLVAQNESNKAHLQLVRAMGLWLDTTIKLTDRLQYGPADGVTVADARTEALKHRSDLRAQQEKESTSRLMASSVRMERLPTLGSFVDYGTTGTTDSALTSLLPTTNTDFRRRTAGRPAG